MTKVRIPPTLRAEVGGVREVEAGGATMREVLDDLASRFPGLGGGVVFAALPLIGALLLLVVMALARGGEPQQTWILAVVGEALRWGIYGVFLGLV